MAEEDIRVVGINKFNHVGKVYDLNVKDEHNYVVGDVSVHNSAAGSEICYLAGITGIDPLRNKLMFERFLNPSRFNYPDIDLDIQSHTNRPGYTGKDVLIQSLSDKFPFNGHIVNEMRASTIILLKKLGNAMGIPFQDVNKLTTDNEVANTYLLEDEYTGWLKPQLEKIGIQWDYRWAELEKYIYFCYKYGGNGRGDNAKGLLWNSSIHASGVIMYPGNNKNVLPKSSQGVIYRGHDLEKMGYIKYDILSLDALNPINHFIKRIEEDTGKKFEWEDNSDEETWKTMQRGDTDFVFQFASPGMKRALKIVKPSNIDVLAELNSLYRPGCIKAGIFERYLTDDWTDEEKVVGQFLKEEFGEQHSYAMIFQEDIMKVVEKMAGFSLADADLIRRAMQRKEKDTMDSYKQQFLDGFKKDKYGDIAETVWDTIEAFATYTFNKSHSVAYSCIAYWTAYLFTNYKYEYLEYLINIGKDKREIIKYLSKDHKIIYPTLETTNTTFEISESEIKLPTVSVQDDKSIVRYLLNLNPDKNKMIVKYGIFDNFCVDRKNLRDIFKELDKKKKNALTDMQIEELEKSSSITELIKKLSALDFLDYEEGAGFIKVGVKKTRSTKEFVLRTTANAEVLAHNCQEDAKAYGIVRSNYVDSMPEIPYDYIVEKFQSVDDPDINMRTFLRKLCDTMPAIRKINNENSWYRVVCKDTKLTGWPKANIIFDNDIVEMRVKKSLVPMFNKFNKNHPINARFNVEFYINRDGEPDYGIEIVEVEEYV